MSISDSAPALRGGAALTDSVPALRGGAALTDSAPALRGGAAMRACLLVAGLSWLWCATAQAGDSPRALVFAPHTGAAARDARVNKEVRAKLVETKRFELLPEPAFDLEGTQLAVDCVDASERCYRVVLTQAQADVLIAASTTHARTKLTLTLIYYDAKAGELRSESRSDTELSRALLDQIPAMLSALIPAKAEPKPIAVAETDDTPKPKPLTAEEAIEPQAPAPEPIVAREGGFPLGPVLLAAGGALAIGGGVVLGAMMKGTQRDYRDSAVTTQAQADAADSTRKLGERQAVIANVLFGVGAAAIVASGVWLAIDLTSGGAPEGSQTALVPMFGPHAAGLVLSGTFEEPSR